MKKSRPNWAKKIYQKKNKSQIFFYFFLLF